MRSLREYRSILLLLCLFVCFVDSNPSYARHCLPFFIELIDPATSPERREELLRLSREYSTPFVRNPKQFPPAQIDYVRAQVNGLKEFITFYEDENRTDLLEAMKQQHKIVVEANYESGPGMSSTKKNIKPGVLRTNSLGINEYIGDQEFMTLLGLGFVEPEYHEDKILTVRREVASWRTPIEGIPYEFQPLNFKEKNSYWIKHVHPTVVNDLTIKAKDFNIGIEDWVPKNGWNPITNIIQRFRANKVYAKASVEAYEKRGLELIQKIRLLNQNLKSGSLTETERAEALQHIGDYYHVVINAQFFNGVNNSIAMAQVNFLLSRFGFEPIPHRKLDYLAYVSPTPIFRTIFRETVNASRR